jgi:hypothetical protein
MMVASDQAPSRMSRANGQVGAIAACFLTRELQPAGFQKIRHATTIAQHIRPAALSAKSVPTLSIQAELRRQFCGAFRVANQHRETHHWGRVLMPKASLFFHHFGYQISDSVIYRSHTVQVENHRSAIMKPICRTPPNVDSVRLSNQ